MRRTTRHADERRPDSLVREQLGDAPGARGIARSRRDAAERGAGPDRRHGGGTLRGGQNEILQGMLADHARGLQIARQRTLDDQHEVLAPTDPLLDDVDRVVTGRGRESRVVLERDAPRDQLERPGVFGVQQRDAAAAARLTLQPDDRSAPLEETLGGLGQIADKRRCETEHHGETRGDLEEVAAADLTIRLDDGVVHDVSAQWTAQARQGS